MLQFAYMTLGTENGLPSDYCRAQRRHRRRNIAAQTVQQWHVPRRSPALIYCALLFCMVLNLA